MSQRIWKFPLPLHEVTGEDAHFDIDMPQGSRIISIAPQYNIPHMWAIVDPHKLKVTRHFILRGTGHSIPDDAHYHGSLETISAAVSYIWHVFEVEQ